MQKNNHIDNNKYIEKTHLNPGDNNSCLESTKCVAAFRLIPRWRLWLYRFIAAVIIPIATLFVLEFTLRVFGYGYPARAMVKTEYQGQSAYYNNYQFGWRFWPPVIARESEPYIFTTRKPKDTYRIFVLGGSAALGTPEPAYAFCRSLEAMLEKAYSEVNFEVINTSITAINSHVVLPIAKSCSSKNGDLFIVYLGNNEVIGPYGAGTIFAPLSDNMSFIRLDKAIQTTRLGQMFKNIRNQSQSRNIPQVWGGSKMFMENLLRKDNENLTIVYNHYKKNLEDITDTFVKSGGHVILCSVGSNIKDCAPFASLHRSGLTSDEKAKWDSHYEKGIDCETSGRYNDALQDYLAAAEIDATYADLCFRIGRMYWATGAFEKAREQYVLAREYDTLRLRADNRINEIVREVAENNTGKGVFFLDSVKVFEQHSPHNTPGEELFLEHVHMNFKGNYLLANAVFQQVVAILPESIRNKRSHLSEITEKQCRDRLAFTDWDNYLLHQNLLESFIKKAPFTSRSYNDELITALEQELEILKSRCSEPALKVIEDHYIKVIAQSPGDRWLHWKYAQLLTKGMNKPQDGAEQYLIVTELLPNYYAAYTTHALTLFSIGDFNNAIKSGLKALEINPYDADAHHIVGVSLQQKGNIDTAMEHFGAEVRIRPDHSHGFNRMGVILDKQGKAREAEQIYREGLTYSPDDVALHYNLALLMIKHNRMEEAVNDLQKALESNPNSMELQGLLHKIQSAKNKP